MAARRKKNVKKPVRRSVKKHAAVKAAAKKTAKKTPIKKAPAKKPRAPVIAHPRKRILRRALPPVPRRALGASPYDSGLDRNAANYQPLTPLSHLERAATTYPDTIAVIHGKTRMDYAQFYQRCRRLGSALARHGIKKNDTV